MTLVELMITMAILVIVLAVGYSFDYYVSKSYTVASSQTELQLKVRMATELIKDKAHFADYMKILEDDSNVIGQLDQNYDQAIYVEDGSLIYYKDGTATNFGNISDNVRLEIDFNELDEFFLSYNVRGHIDGEQTYEISSEIQKNIEDYGPIVKDFGDENSTGKAVIFGFDDAEP
nr:prepilin-type N-terminal cleavage/methylation domain-containing protein [Desulfocucumis palustris]